MKKKISIVIPALNEAPGIGYTIGAIPREELAHLGYETHVLLVDNGSIDGTSEIARKAGAEVIYEPKRGYGSAYKTGFAHAQGDIIATSDADGTYPIEDVLKLVKMLEEEQLDFITTNRFAFMEDSSMSYLHKLGNFVLTLTMRLLFGLKLRDSQSGMWVFKKSLLDDVDLTSKSNSMAFSEELKIEACHFLGCRWKEVPIHYRIRLGHLKLKTWKHGFDNLFHLVQIRLSR